MYCNIGDQTFISNNQDITNGKTENYNETTSKGLIQNQTESHSKLNQRVIFLIIRDGNSSSADRDREETGDEAEHSGPAQSTTNTYWTRG